MTGDGDVDELVDGDPDTSSDTRRPGATVAIIGAGAIGTRLARQLVSTPSIERVVLREPRRAHLEMVVGSLGPKASADEGVGGAPIDADIVVLASDPGDHGDLAAAFLRRGQSIVSTSDSVVDVEALLALDHEARERGCTVAAGAGFAPGLSCMLAAQAAKRFDVLDELHVAKVGTGGPACARHHHWALSRRAVDWREGSFVKRPGGSGRELCWFPDPVGAVDCYRAALPDALLLEPAFPGVRRITARMAANRRDRLTMRLPMLWPTHPEGGPGAVRVEARGRRGGATDVVVFGAMDRPAVAGGAVGALAVLRILDGAGDRSGAGGLATLFASGPFLADLRDRGVRAAVFQGSAAGEPESAPEPAPVG